VIQLSLTSLPRLEKIHVAKPSHQYPCLLRLVKSSIAVPGVQGCSKELPKAAPTSHTPPLPLHPDQRLEEHLTLLPSPVGLSTHPTAPVTQAWHFGESRSTCLPSLHAHPRGDTRPPAAARPQRTRLFANHTQDTGGMQTVFANGN